MKAKVVNMRDKVIYCVRRFLNRKGYYSTALIFAEIRKSFSFNQKTKKQRTYYDAELKISDCDRSINLMIDTHSKTSIKNTIEKLDCLIKTLTEFRNIFVKEMKSKV